MANTNVGDRYPVTQNYLMSRAQAINFPSKYLKYEGLKKDEVYGVVIDIPMSSRLLTTMVCFINGSANLYFNNGEEYSGASMKYKSLVQITHAMVVNANQALKKAKKTNVYDIPGRRYHFIYLLTGNGVYKIELKQGVIPESEPELRSLYVMYQRVLQEIRNCQLKDEAQQPSK